MLKFSNVKTIPHLNIIFVHPLRILILTACGLCACSTSVPSQPDALIAESFLAETLEEKFADPAVMPNEDSDNTLHHSTELSQEPHVNHDVEEVGPGHSANEARPYDETRDAQVDLAQALKDAATYNKRAMIVMGANWCHDSRALATHFETERFQTLLNPNYIVTYIDVGQKNRNEDIVRNFGLPEGIVGTPTVIITDSAGTVLNLDTAPTWRNAASRTADETFEYFQGFANDALNQ